MKFNNRNVSISAKAGLGRNVRIGDNSIVYDGVEIADDSTICNDCIIGEPLNSYYCDSSYQNPVTEIGPNALIRSHAVIYAGCRIGAGFSSGHRVTIRENSVIGEKCAVGTQSDIQGNVKIGHYCRLHSSVHIAQGSAVGDFVFFYPFSVMANDSYPPSEDIKGATIGSYTQVGVHAVILPGVQVGENCLIGANALVSKRVPDYSLVTGEPAKVLMDLREYVVMGKGKPYPWMYRFERGMPWEGIGFDAWIERGRSRSRIAPW